MIKAVLFDYGGVLTNAGRVGSIRNTITRLFGIDIGWDKLDDLHDQLRRGLITTEDFFRQLAERHQQEVTFTDKDWHGIDQSIFERSEPVYRLAASLRKRGIRTGIISNVYQMTADMLRLVGNYDEFDPVILSSEVHLAKPDPGIYHLALDYLAVSPNEAIFVDDQPKCIPPAVALGVHVVLARTPEQIVSDVERIINEQA